MFAWQIVVAGPLHDAARKGDLDKVNRFILQGEPVNEKDNADRSALYWAAQEGYLSVLKILADNGADVNAVSVDDDGATPLIAAVYRGHHDVVKFLLDHGANIDVEDKDGFTAISWAIKQDESDIIRLLASRVANIDVSIPSGFSKANQGTFTFLSYAAGRTDDEFVDFLISRGANTNAKDQRGMTPLHSAAVKGNLKIVKMLIEHHADVNAASHKDSYLTKLGKFVHKFVHAGVTPLHLAVENAHVDMVKLLIRNRARMDARSSGNIYTGGVNYLQYSGVTPLKLAELHVEHKPGLRAEYERIADFLRSYLEVGGPIDKVAKAINEYATVLRKLNRDTDAVRVEQHAQAFSQSMQSTESVYLGFDPSTLLDEFAGLLKEQKQNTKADEMEDLAAWYFHANLSAAIRAGEEYKESQEESIDEEDF